MWAESGIPKNLKRRKATAITYIGDVAAARMTALEDTKADLEASLSAVDDAIRFCKATADVALGLLIPEKR